MKNAIKKTFALVMTLCLLLVSVGALAMDGADSAKELKAVQALAKGNKGSAVRALTYQLKAHGYLSVEPSSFNETVKQAVMRFQYDNGLIANGVVDQKTVSVLLSGKGTVTDKPVEIVPDPVDPGAPDSADKNFAVLKKSAGMSKGAKGEAVRALTSELKYYGYLDVVPSTYNDTVVAAVKHFQYVNGLKTVTGVLTQETIDKLVSGKKIISVETPTQPSKPNAELPEFSKDKGDNNYMENLKVATSLSKGDSGQAVRALASLLNAKKYLDVIPSTYNETVKAAVMKFQFNNGLKADGVANKATINLLLSGNGLANPTPGNNEVVPEKPADPAKDSNDNTSGLAAIGQLKKGDKGQAVRALATLLNKHVDTLNDAVPSTYNDAVVEAVKAYQTKVGLAATGVANAATISKLLGNK